MEAITRGSEANEFLNPVLHILIAQCGSLRSETYSAAGHSRLPVSSMNKGQPPTALAGGNFSETQRAEIEGACSKDEAGVDPPVDVDQQGILWNSCHVLA